jgi:hypothetical protein
VPPMAALLAASSPEPQQQPKQPEASASAGATVSIQELKAAAEAAKQPPESAAGEGQQQAAPEGSAAEPAAAALHLSGEDDAAAAQLELLHALLLLLPSPEVGSLLRPVTNTRCRHFQHNLTWLHHVAGQQLSTAARRRCTPSGHQLARGPAHWCGFGAALPCTAGNPAGTSVLRHSGNRLYATTRSSIVLGDYPDSLQA